MFRYSLAFFCLFPPLVQMTVSLRARREADDSTSMLLLSLKLPKELLNSTKSTPATEFTPTTKLTTTESTTIGKSTTNNESTTSSPTVSKNSALINLPPSPLHPFINSSDTRTPFFNPSPTLQQKNYDNADTLLMLESDNPPLRRAAYFFAVVLIITQACCICCVIAVPLLAVFACIFLYRKIGPLENWTQNREDGYRAKWEKKTVRKLADGSMKSGSKGFKDKQ
ncbi:unnamed protein product, partial [Mesorhabditis belari]|uniref:Uncharacterized protein n=1 Tax=Mesorhabditis belari TaxID=2138241 RepID=A0AAF3EFG7_9BILA